MLQEFTMLYVEDNEEMQSYIKRFLKNKVKNFYQAFDGEEGLRLFKEKKPDIILSDIYMSKLDGLEMAKIIKDIDKNQHIMMTSAFDDKDVLIKAINIGVDYFIPKPISFDLLLKRLNIIAENIKNRLYVEQAKERELLNLKKLAYYDNLTGLLNRISFDENLELLIKQKSEFALFFIDLDNFKTINDTFGHKIGDEVLKSVATHIKKVIREDDIFARLSGDEFALIIKNTDKEVINNIAKKIINVINEIPVYKDINGGCSIGIAFFPKDATTKKDLIHFADLAMYEAKKSKSTYKYFKG